jgi:hypothetical protein
MPRGFLSYNNQKISKKFLKVNFEEICYFKKYVIWRDTCGISLFFGLKSKRAYVTLRSVYEKNEIFYKNLVFDQ